MAVTAPPKPGSPAARNVDEYDIVLPDGLTVDALNTSIGAEPHTDDEPVVEPGAEGDEGHPGGGARRAPEPAVRSEERRPAAPAAPRTQPAPPGVIAERRRRQDAERENERLERELEEANARTRALQQATAEARAREAAKPVKVVLTDADQARLREQAASAKDEVEAALVGARFVVDKMNVALEEQGRRVEAVVTPRNNVRQLEDEFIEKHADYDDIMHRSGIFRRLEVDPTTRQAREPGLAEMIYRAENPAAKAYELAKHILRKKGLLKDEPEPEPDEHVDEEPAPSAAAPERRAAAPAPNGNGRQPAPDPIAEAEARGRAKALAEVDDRSAARGRGIRAIPSAGGPPRARLDKQQLDELSRTNPEHFLRIMEANPALEFEYYS